LPHNRYSWGLKHITSACRRTAKPLRALSAADAKRYVMRAQPIG